MDLNITLGVISFGISAGVYQMALLYLNRTGKDDNMILVSAIFLLLSGLFLGNVF